MQVVGEIGTNYCNVEEIGGKEIVMPQLLYWLRAPWYACMDYDHHHIEVHATSSQNKQAEKKSERATRR
jgi:hypothetical protein